MDYQYKLIVSAGEEQVTKEYEHCATSLEHAEEIAKQLLAEYITDYPDTFVECYDMDEDIKYPSDDYRCWQRDCFGDEYWKWMKMGTYCRIGMYI